MLPNVWAINRDPALFGLDADHFSPERHLDSATGRLAAGPAHMKGEGHVTFGFGRRACVGRHVAKDLLFINIATLLWALRFKAKSDSDGEKVPIDVDGHIDLGAVV